MAYAATVTLQPVGYDRGRPLLALTVVETECASTSEWSTATAVDSNGQRVNLPKQFTIVRQKVYKTAGTAATVAPILARATGITAAGVNSISTQAAAASVDDAGRYPGYAPSQVLYGRSTPNAGADNSITTEVLILVGWES